MGPESCEVLRVALPSTGSPQAAQEGEGQADGEDERRALRGEAPQLAVAARHPFHCVAVVSSSAEERAEVGAGWCLMPVDLWPPERSKCAGQPAAARLRTGSPIGTSPNPPSPRS